MAKEQYYGTGRRKSSVARVRLVPGNGKITINGRTIDEYFGLDTLCLLYTSPSPRDRQKSRMPSSA